MTAKDRRLLREAIRLIRPDCAHLGQNFENGMKILYRLAGMNRAADYITQVQQTPAIPLTDFFKRNNGKDT